MNHAAAVALATALALAACASTGDDTEAQPDPNHKQYVTGTRLPFKGRGGPDSVKSVSRESMADEMNTHQMPHRQSN